MYDYLIVGSGLFGAVFAHEMKAAGKSCLVLERRVHVGGMCIVKKRKVSGFINMELIFSILRIKRFGIR